MAHVWKGFAGVNAFTNRSIAWRTGTTAGLASALLAATVCTGKLLCALLFFSFGQKARVYKTFTPSHRPDRVDRGAEEESDGWSASIFNFMFLLLNEYTLFFLPVIKMRCSMLCNVKRLNSVRWSFKLVRLWRVVHFLALFSFLMYNFVQIICGRVLK